MQKSKLSHNWYTQKLDLEYFVFAKIIEEMIKPKDNHYKFLKIKKQN